MHQHVVAFIQSAVDTFDLQGPVYEFGVCAVRDTGKQCDSFSETGYTAGDPSDELVVDQSVDLSRLPFPDEAARTVMCVNTLEHVLEPSRAVEEMIRILVPGGMMLVCSSIDPQMPEHPSHYWRPTPNAIQTLMAGLEATLVGWQGAERYAHTLFGIGCKPPVTGRFITGAHRFLDCFQSRLDRMASQMGWPQKLKRLLVGWSANQVERRKRRDFYKAQFILHLPIGEHFKHELLVGCLPQEKTGTRLDMSQ